VFYIGMAFEWVFAKDEPRGYLRAIDPLTGKAKWEYPTDVLMNVGTLVTDVNLLLSGDQTGELYCL